MVTTLEEQKETFLLIVTFLKPSQDANSRRKTNYSCSDNSVLFNLISQSPFIQGLYVKCDVIPRLCKCRI